MTSILARRRALIAGFAIAALLALPAAAGAATASGDAGCPQVAVAQPFAPWGDDADYFLAPDGGFEHGGAAWTLRAGADVTDGSQPFGDPTDVHSLRLPAGSSATTAPFCIGVEHRSMRFFARSATSGTLNVDVLYADAHGAPRAVRLGELGGAGAWAPSDVMPMVVNTLAAERGNALEVRLRFAPRGAAAWTLDDVHVDPYRGR